MTLHAVLQYPRTEYIARLLLEWPLIILPSEYTWYDTVLHDIIEQYSDRSQNSRLLDTHEQELMNRHTEECLSVRLVYPSCIKSHFQNSPYMDITHVNLIFEVTTMDSQELGCMRNPEWLEQPNKQKLGGN